MIREASARTEAVSAAPTPTIKLFRQCACGNHTHSGDVCESCKKKQAATLQRAAVNEAEIDEAPGIVHEVLRSSGQLLDARTRAEMGSRFGHDFSGVRVHTDPQAAASAQAVHALAYTVGRDMVFAAGQYAPGTQAGQKLLAHELTHVVQQAGQAWTMPVQLPIAAANDPAEREARFAGQNVESAPAFNPVTQTAAQISRQPDDQKKAQPKLPVAFPDKGIRVIGSGAQDLITILQDCTGMSLSLDKANLLTARKGTTKSKNVSATAKSELANHLKVAGGIILDTDPKNEGVSVGAFSKDTPGYHQIDVGNINVLAGASGEAKGLTACDAVMHEISEAAAGRTMSQKSKDTGDVIFPKAHESGLKVEDAIRKESGRPSRSKTDQGSIVKLGEQDSTNWIYLESTIYGQDKDIYTQLAAIRFTITTVDDKNKLIKGDNQIVASTVVKGLVTFTTQLEGLKVFNLYAGKMGLKAIPIPKSMEEKKP